MVSNAAERSKRTSIEPASESKDVSKSFCTFSGAISVDAALCMHTVIAQFQHP